MARTEGRRAVHVVHADGTETAVLAEAVLLATGRQAQFHDLHLDVAGVQTWERGIAVDATMRTSASHIWAAGDVTGRHMYTHAGDYAAEVAGWNAAAGEPERGMDWRVVPRPVYAIPETASIGLLESEARAQGLEVDVARVSYQDIARAVIQGETEGFAKIIAERSSGQILGAAIVGAQACELIGAIAVAMAGRVVPGSSAIRSTPTRRSRSWSVGPLTRWGKPAARRLSRRSGGRAGDAQCADHRRSIHRPCPNLAVR